MYFKYFIVLVFIINIYIILLQCHLY